MSMRLQRQNKKKNRKSKRTKQDKARQMGHTQEHIAAAASKHERSRREREREMTFKKLILFLLFFKKKN